MSRRYSHDRERRSSRGSSRRERKRERSHHHRHSDSTTRSSSSSAYSEKRSKSRNTQAAVGGVSEEERKRRERAELWKKSKLQLVTSSLLQGNAASQPTAAPAHAPSRRAAMFAAEEEEEEERQRAPPSFLPSALLLEKGKAEAEVPAEERREAQSNDNASGGEEKGSNKADDEDEEDALEALMAGIEQQAQQDLRETTRKASSQSGSQAAPQRAVAAARDFSDDETQNFVTLSDEEFFVSGLVRDKKKVLEDVDHSKVTYGAFRKDFYIETEEVARMSEAEVKALRKKLDHIKVRGVGVPKPITSFTQAGLSDKTLAVCKHYGYERPTPIQAQAIPCVMSGFDVIGIAKTGSGKTLAFVLPLLRHVMDQDPIVASKDGPIALVLAPTRELTTQIDAEIRKFRKCGVRSVAVYGGADVSNQIGKLKRGAEVVVATPGRLIDILTLNGGRITNLRRVTYLVMDEADRMFDMGFEPQISRIVSNIRPNRQTCMFSATFPTKVETLARRVLRKPVEIIVGGRLQVCGDVEQHIEVREEGTKFNRLLQLLGRYLDKGKVLIFSDRQNNADDLFRRLQANSYQCLTLHGGKDQLDRLSTISDFKSGVCDIMIATSVAARGLDVPELVLVVNYEVPNHIEDYVHRVGRTGRAGRKGTAFTFITPDEERYAPALVKALKQSKREVPAALQQLADGYRKKRAAGEDVQRVISGYGGKGFDFTEEARRKRKAEQEKQRRLQMAAYGIALSDDEEEAELEGEADADIVEARSKAKQMEEASNDPQKLVALLEALDDPSIVKVERGISEAMDIDEDALKAAGLAGDQHHEEEGPRDEVEAARQQVLSQFGGAAVAGGAGGGGKKKQEQVAADKIKKAQELVKAFALRAALDKKREDLARAAERSANEPKQVHYECEVDINDFPQEARWRVTNKEALQQLSEFNPGVAITVRGTHIPPGRNPMAGERKLHLLLEGPTEMALKLAKRDVLRILKETTVEQLTRGRTKEQYAKYSVV